MNKMHASNSLGESSYTGWGLHLLCLHATPGSCLGNRNLLILMYLCISRKLLFVLHNQLILSPVILDLLNMGKQLQNQNRVQWDAPFHLCGSGTVFTCPSVSVNFFSFPTMWFYSKHVFSESTC